MAGVQYIVDESGDPTAVIVPIDDWVKLLDKVYEYEPERNDTEYLLRSSIMKKRWIEARRRKSGKSWEEVQDALGL